MSDALGRVLPAVAALLLLTACGSGTDDYRPAAATPSSVVSAQSFSTELADTSMPVDILLIGDGTGPTLGGWVYLTMQALGEKYGRPVDIRDWDFASGTGYVEPPTHVTDGSGRPITLWNASVSRNVAFLSSALPGIRPAADVDLVLVNNGLDMGADTLARESIPLMRTLRNDIPDAAVIAVLQPAPPEPADLHDAVAGNVRDLGISARKNDIQTIDVATAFDAVPNLYDSGARYAGLDGQRLWSSTVLDSLVWDVSVPTP